MNNVRIELDVQIAGTIGKLEVGFVPSSISTITSTTALVLVLYPHPWNLGYWSTPNSVTTDPLICYINLIRVSCIYSLTSSILSVTMQIGSVILSSTS
jgi:hypothetical protein